MIGKRKMTIDIKVSEKYTAMKCWTDWEKENGRQN